MVDNIEAESVALNYAALLSSKSFHTIKPVLLGLQKQIILIVDCCVLWIIILSLESADEHAVGALDARVVMISLTLILISKINSFLTNIVKISAVIIILIVYKQHRATINNIILMVLRLLFNRIIIILKFVILINWLFCLNWRLKIIINLPFFPFLCNQFFVHV